MTTVVVFLNYKTRPNGSRVMPLFRVCVLRNMVSCL